VRKQQKFVFLALRATSVQHQVIHQNHVPLVLIVLDQKHFVYHALEVLVAMELPLNIALWDNTHYLVWMHVFPALRALHAKTLGLHQ